MLPSAWPSTLPAIHRAFLEHAVPTLALDTRLLGVAAAGSFIADRMDAFSDLDLLVAVEPAAFAAVMADRPAIAQSLGELLAAFTGEHVGEPRLLVCLYGPALLHVDLKFVAVADVATGRVDDPVLLWSRDDRMPTALAQSRGHYPPPDPQWIEDRFWVWMHYGASKIGRGELLEAAGFLGFIRSAVLAPLGLQQRGLPATGLRRIEAAAPALAAELAATAGDAQPQALWRGLLACVTLYERLRDCLDVDVRRSAAEPAVRAWLAQQRAGSDRS